MSEKPRKENLRQELSHLEKLWKKQFSEEILLFPFQTKNEIKDFLIKNFNDFDSRLFTDKFIPQSLNLNGKTYLSSLSHCPNQGLFMITKNPSSQNILGLGADIEQKSRLTKKLIKRISSSEEIQRLSEKLDLSFHLWTVKESSFKALPLILQPPVISKLILENFSQFPISSNSYAPLETTTLTSETDSFSLTEDSSSFITFKTSTKANLEISSEANSDAQANKLSQIDISILGLSLATKNLVISLALCKKQ